MCLSCCPLANNADGFLTTLFPVCSKCWDTNKHKSVCDTSVELDEKEKPSDSVTETPPTPISSPSTPPTPPSPNEEGTPPVSIVTMVPPVSGERTNTPETTGQNSRVYSFYLRKCCKFYKSETQCKFAHPALCNQFVKTGKCNNPEMCKNLYHPPLCKFSVRNQSCLQDKCKFFHLRSQQNFDSQKVWVNPFLPNQSPLTLGNINPNPLIFQAGLNSNNSNPFISQPGTINQTQLNNPAPYQTQANSVSHQDFWTSHWNDPQDLRGVLQTLLVQVQNLTTWKNSLTS